MFKSAATKIAHNTTIPALAGNSDLRPLQDLITAEKTVLVSLQRLSSDLIKSSEALRVWGQGEGDDLGDILTASTAVLAHFTAALSTYASLHHTMRDNMKAVRTHEEELDELRRRRRRVGASAESAEKKLNKMSPEHKNLGAQTELLNKLREEMRTMDGDIVRNEAGLSDFKRKCAKNWMTLKLGGLVECCEKGAIVGDMGKHIIQFIPEDVTQPGLPRAYYNAHSRVGDLVFETQRAVSQVAFSGSPSGRAYGSATGNIQSQTSAPSNQPAQGSLGVSYLPTPSLGSELTLNVNAYNAQSVPQPSNRRSSADELGVQLSEVNTATQFSSLPTRERNPAPATDSARPLSLSARLGDGTGRTDENQSLMASIADALSQSHREMTLEEAMSLGHTHDEPAPKYEPFAPAIQSEIHGPNGHASTPAEGPSPRRNMRRSTSPPSLPPGAAPAAVRAWDDGMGQGEDGAHSDRPASSSQRMPSQRRITSSELDGEEEDGLAYDRDDPSEDEATDHAYNNINSGGEGSLSESGKEDGTSVRNLIDTKQSSPPTDNMQRPSTSAPIQGSSYATISVNNAASTSPSMEPPLRAESQRRIPRVPPPSVDTNVDMPNRPASPHGGPKSGTISEDDAQTDESADERAHKAAAKREVSRELDALAFSANSPTTGSNYVTPLGPPPARGPPGHAPQGHPPYQPQLPIIQTPSPRSQLPYDSNPPSPLAPPNAPFASRSVSPHPQATPTRGRSPPSPSLDGRPFPPNSSFGSHGASPLQASSSPRPSYLDVVPGRGDSLGPKTPTYRTPPEFPRHTPPFSSPLMAKSTSSLGGGGAPGGVPRTISAAAFRRQQARSPSGTGNELGPADTSPLALRRPSPVPTPPPKGPTRRLSVINPDPPAPDEDGEFDYIGAYGGGDDEGGGKRPSGGYGSGKYVSDLEKR